VLNAGAAIYAGGRAESIADGVGVARRAIDSGAAADALARFVAETVRLMGAGTT
jgi:anthranilate phosphoribosyltransferase